MARRRSIEIEKVVRGVVADVDVGLAVTVDIDNEDAQPLAVVAQAGLLAHIAERAVAVIAKEAMRQGAESFRRANVAATAIIAIGGMVFFEGPVDILADVQIGVAVAIEVGPGGAGGPQAFGQTSFLGHIHKPATV